MGQKTNFEDLISTSTSSIIPNIEEMLTSSKRKPAFKSMFDEEQLSEPVIKKPISEILEEKEIQKIEENTHKKQITAKIALNKELSKKQQFKQKQIVVTPEENNIIKQEIEEIKGVELPENVNYAEVEVDVNEALNSIPDGSNFNLIDIDIKPIESSKDKTGYYKTKLTIGKGNLPEQINRIASYVKKQSKGLISPRVCDLRVIANTNKTQLRGSNLKLSVNTVVFKPDFTKLKVNKGTRFMISIPENYETTRNIIVYLQESRAKKILEINSTDFPNENVFNEFIGDRIAEYYVAGYTVTLKKLELRNVNNPLFKVITDIVSTGEYTAKPYVEENHIYSVDFFSKGPKNQWLYLNIFESDVPGTYKIVAKNSIDPTWQYQISRGNVVLKQLLDNFYSVLDSSYDKNWDNELNIDSEYERTYYLYDKLSHFKLKKALIYINDLGEQSPELGIYVKETLSKKDAASIISKDYDSESIIGKTSQVDYFILTYLAYPVIGGDKRNGAEYTGSQDYKQKYSIKNENNYSDKSRTILKREGTERNYNSRIYMFQLEYSVKGEKHIYRNNNWDNLLEETGIFTNVVQFPKTKF